MVASHSPLGHFVRGPLFPTDPEVFAAQLDYMGRLIQS